MGKKEEIISEDEVKEEIISEDEWYNICRNVYDRVHLLKKERRESWPVFQKFIGTKQSSISAWKNKKKETGIKTEEAKLNKPSLEALIKIALTCNVSIDWLLGLSDDKKVQPERETYEGWINFIEEALDNETLENQYYPSLDDWDDPVFKPSKEQIEVLEKYMKLQFGDDWEKTEYQNPYDDFEYVEIKDKVDYDKINKGFIYRSYEHLGLIHKYEAGHIYDVEKDMYGTFPDVLRVKDSFLKCLLVCLAYAKRKDGKYTYERYKNDIIKRYGKERIMNFDVYDFNYLDYKQYKNLKYAKHFRKNAKFYYISYGVFGQYKGISDIIHNYEFDELDRILNELKFWKKEAEQGNLKKMKRHKTDFF